MADIDPPKKSKRIQVFRFAEGHEFVGEAMTMEPFTPDALKGFGRMRAAAADAGRGEELKMLFNGGPNGMSIAYAWFKSGFVLPKHSHNADCIYYILAGELRMGSLVLGKGDGIFVPADAGYTYDVGPDGLEVLEIRNSGQFNFALKENEPAHWDKLVKSVEDNGQSWHTEVKPSERWQDAGKGT